MTVTLAKTWPQTIAYGETKIGIPYSEVLDGGTGPNYFDCSGLMQNIFWWAGDSAFTRTTYSQWGDTRYTHMGPYKFGQALPAQAGWIVYVHVNGEADPGHVGLAVGDGLYLNAPHTGENVQIESIPNTSGEHVYGYLVPTYASAPVPVPTPPIPPLPLPIKEDTMSMQELSNGEIVISAVGAGSRDDHLLVFTLNPTNPNAPNFNVIDVTDGIGTADPYTVQSA